MTRRETGALTILCPPYSQHRSQKLTFQQPEVRLPNPPSPHLGVYLIIPGVAVFTSTAQSLVPWPLGRQASDSRQGPCGRRAATVPHIWPLPRGRGWSSPTAVSLPSVPSFPSPPPRLSSSKSHSGRAAAGWEGSLRDAPPGLTT